MNHTHPDSSKPLIYENCNSYPHMCLCYWLYSSHLTRGSDTSKGDLWLCSWMEAKEGEALSHCALQLIFTQDKASFIHFPCQSFIGLSQNGWVMMAPTSQNGTRRGQMSDVWDSEKKKERNRKCRGQDKKAAGMGGWMEERGEEEIPARTVWTWT